jgi:hypothetical protein
MRIKQKTGANRPDLSEKSGTSPHSKNSPILKLSKSRIYVYRPIARQSLLRNMHSVRPKDFDTLEWLDWRRMKGPSADVM